MRLPEFGVRYPTTNIMIFFCILVLGVYSLTRLPVDLMPEIEPPVISVITSYEGASAQDVETKVTEVIENNLATVSNLDKLTSRSLGGISIVRCRFKWGTNLDEASNDIRDKLEFAKRLLPEEIDTPIVFKFNTSMIPILYVGVTSSEEIYPQLYHIVDKQVGDALKRIPGVGSVQMYGGMERQINVNIDRARLEAYHLSVQQIVDRLAQENITLPAGDLKTGYKYYTLRVPGEFTDPAQARDIIISESQGKIVYLKDVAQVSDSYKEVTMIVRMGGRNAIIMMVQKRAGANTVEVANAVKEELKKIQKRLPYDLKFSLIMDTSDHVVSSIKNLTQTVYWGGLFVILVVYLFLRQLRPSLIIALTIPFSLIIAFIFMFFFGYTINIMSLSSLAIAIGMVVDNAIVIVDNAYRHRERGQKPEEAAFYGASEVGLAVSASTFTTVIVFFPMVFVTGIVGIMFKQLAMIISITLLASLFTALTFTPMLCSKLLTVLPQERFKKEEKSFSQRFFEASGRFYEKLESNYAKLLTLALDHKKTTVLIAVAIFVSSVILVSQLGTEFIPEEDTGDLSVQIELPVGTRVEETDKIAKQAEQIFKQDIPEALTVFSRLGQTGGARIGAAFGARLGSNVMLVGAKLTRIDQRKRSIKEIAASIRPKITALLGVKKVDIMAGSPFARILLGGGKPVSIEILGHDFTTTDEIAYQMMSELAKIKGVVDITISREIGAPELQIEVDRAKASSLGLNMQSITEALRTYFYGKTASRYREAGELYDIFVRLKDSDRMSIKDIEDIPLSSASGSIIRLSNVAKVVHRTGPVEIERQNQERIVTVEANIYRRSLGEVAREIRQVIARMKVPADVTINLGSDIEEQMKAFRDLFLLFILGGLLVYMVMAAQFESLIDPLIIMFSVPFAFTGVAIGLFVGGITLSVVSFLGLVMLVGIVVNNAIVLVDYINILRKRGLSMSEAIVTGGANRLRPVLMTTITTLVGLLPLALSRGESSEMWRPLGMSMIGGLSVSTLITLVLVPTLYAIFETKIKKRGKR